MSDPRENEIFRAVQTTPEAHPASCTMGIINFPGVNRSACGADHPPPSSAEVMNELELHHRPPSVPTKACHGMTFTFT